MKVYVNAVNAKNYSHIIEHWQRNHRDVTVNEATFDDYDFDYLPEWLRPLARHNRASWFSSLDIQEYALEGIFFDVVVTLTGDYCFQETQNIKIVEPDTILFNELKKYHILIASYEDTVMHPTTFIRTSLWWKLSKELDIQAELNARIDWLKEHFHEDEYDLYFWGSWVLMNRLKWGDL